jgi:hypothetical protein
MYITWQENKLLFPSPSNFLDYGLTWGSLGSPVDALRSDYYRGAGRWILVSGRDWDMILQFAFRGIKD